MGARAIRWVAILLVGWAVTGLAGAQNVQSVRPAVPQATQVAPAVQALQLDYPALYRKEQEKNRQLRAENAELRNRIAEMTRAGGSLVQAYCESPTVSRNTAGARNDCAASGYACEPVSGLCRTRASTSGDCAPGHLYCATTGTCVVADPRACPAP